MDGLRWEEEGMKPEGTRIEEIGLAMPFHAIQPYVIIQK